MYKIFGIPNCDTVKKARVFLEKRKVDVEFVDFKKTMPTLEDIKRWSEAFGGLPLNVKGVTYKKFKSEFEALGEKEQKEFIRKNTSMIKRPILERDGRVLSFGFSEEDYKTALS